MSLPRIAVTSGEPAGIGPELCLRLAGYDGPGHPVILADRDLLVARAEAIGLDVAFRDFCPQNPVDRNRLDVLHVPLAAPAIPGELNPANGAYVLALLDRALAGCRSGEFAAMATAPVHKAVINAAGVHFTGHTEYLAEKSHTEQVVMMLTGGGLRVALVTTHLPLKDISAAITKPLIESVVRILEHDLRHKFGIAKPVILVTGLNPHAGEGGHLGHEEIDTIIPALHALQAEGIDARGPYPADTVFQPFLLKDADAVLAMYHDQGLPVLKYAGFGEGVNITLGLPFIRTSVDHGTALNLAGTGKADSGSLMTAVRAALDMAHNMQKQAV